MRAERYRAAMRWAASEERRSRKRSTTPGTAMVAKIATSTTTTRSSTKVKPRDGRTKRSLEASWGGRSDTGTGPGRARDVPGRSWSHRRQIPADPGPFRAGVGNRCTALQPLQSPRAVGFARRPRAAMVRRAREGEAKDSHDASSTKLALVGRRSRSVQEVPGPQ